MEQPVLMECIASRVYARQDIVDICVNQVTNKLIKHDNKTDFSIISNNKSLFKRRVLVKYSVKLVFLDITFEN